MAYCGLNKTIACMTASLIPEPPTDPDPPDEVGVARLVKKRRFGLDELGDPLTYDDFGEPLTIESAQNYFESYFYAIVDIEKEENDEKSNIGGKDSPFQSIKLTIRDDEDVLENDVLIFPASTNQAWRVKSNQPYLNRARTRQIVCINEVKSYK
jgi:hypothetical protein